jgi:anoctamin-7
LPNPFVSEEPKRYYDLFTSVFEVSKQDRFMGNDRFPVHFTNTQRSFAVNEILQTTPFGRTDKGEIGIDRLVRDGVFQAAYPLHEGDYKYEPTDQQTPSMENNPRRILYDTWAKYRVFYKAQPLDLIREYFGEKVSLYFAWLGEIFRSFLDRPCSYVVRLFDRLLHDLASACIIDRRARLLLRVYLSFEQSSCL